MMSKSWKASKPTDTAPHHALQEAQRKGKPLLPTQKAQREAAPSRARACGHSQPLFCTLQLLHRNPSPLQAFHHWGAPYQNPITGSINMIHQNYLFREKKPEASLC